MKTLILLLVLWSDPGTTRPQGELTFRELNQLIQRFFEANADERHELLGQLGSKDILKAHMVASWKKKLLKLARKGVRAELDSKNFLYDRRRGKYLVQGKSGKSLIFGLHGGDANSGDAGSARSNLGGAIGKLKALAIFPEVLEKTEHGWTEEPTERFLLELIEAIKRTRKIDTNRIYLTGHSLGSYGTWTLGAHNADLFAGLAAFAGAPSPIFDQEDESKRSVVAIEDGVLPNLLNLPIFVYQSLDNPKVAPWSNNFAIQELGRLQKEYGGFEFLYEAVKNRGRDYPTMGPGPGITWATKHVRNPRPKKILWQPMRSWKRMFYWLYWRKPVLNSLVLAEVTGQNHVELQSEADLAGLSILVDERLFDLKQPIVVKVNGKERFNGLVPDTLSTLLLTAAERNDPELLFRARIDL